MYQLYYYPGNANLAPHMHTAVDPYLLMLSRWTRMMLERPAVQRAFAQEGLGEPLF